VSLSEEGGVFRGLLCQRPPSGPISTNNLVGGRVEPVHRPVDADRFSRVVVVGAARGGHRHLPPRSVATGFILPVREKLEVGEKQVYRIS
jgi:hypothetical protein